MRGNSCSPPRAPTWMPSSASRPTVAIEQRTSRGGRKSTVATLTEIYHFLRLLYVKLGVQYCPDCDARIEPQTADAIAARLLKDYRGRKHHAARAADRGAQGPVHRARQMGARQGLSRAAGRRRAAADGEVAAARPVHRAQHRAARRDVERSARRRGANCATRLESALEHGRGVVHVRDAGAARRRAAPPCSPPSAPVRTAAPAFRSSIRGCSPSIRGTAGARAVSAPAAAGAIRRRAKRRGVAWRARASRRAGDGRCPNAPAQRLNPVARHVLFRGRSIAALTASAGAGVRRRACASSSSPAASARLRATCWRSSQRAPRFCATSAWATCSSIAPRRRCPAAKRSASAWRRSSARTCRACATSSMSRPSACTRATMSCCSIRWIGCAPRATRWSSSSMTRTRFAAPITSSIWGPAPAPAAATSWRRAPPRNSRS